MNAERPCALNSINPHGKFVVEHWYEGKLLGVYPIANDVTNEGKNKLWDTMFRHEAQTDWWLSLINYTGYSALAATDTYFQINGTNGWDEFTNYLDTNNGDNATTRPAWNNNAASGQEMTNTTKAIFTITGGGGTLKGLFLVGGNAIAQTKGDHSGGPVIWATALFATGDFIVFTNSQLKVVYTVSA
jgi:hypothetical protein